MNDTGCWIWQGATTTPGYGKVFWKGKLYDAHRAMYLALNGSIPDGHYVCHSCDNKLCLNPLHLFVALPKVNTADMIAKGRNSHGASHSEVLRKAWTPELRAMRSKQAKEWMNNAHNLAAEKAGVPFDWKYCPGCKTWKPHSGFSKNAARFDGLNNYCSPCHSARSVARKKFLATQLASKIS